MSNAYVAAFVVEGFLFWLAHLTEEPQHLLAQTERSIIFSGITRKLYIMKPLNIFFYRCLFTEYNHSLQYWGSIVFVHMRIFFYYGRIVLN